MNKHIGGQRIVNKSFSLSVDVVLWDIFPIRDKELITVYFESQNSPWTQGIWFMTDMGIECNAQKSSSIVLWYGKVPSRVEILCHTNDGKLNIYNVWDRGFGMNSQFETSGMLLEELENGRRYRCNDFGFDAKFDKLVFRIVRK
jgi:hypothetical protein